MRETPAQQRYLLLCCDRVQQACGGSPAVTAGDSSCNSQQSARLRLKTGQAELDDLLPVGRLLLSISADTVFQNAERQMARVAECCLTSLHPSDSRQCLQPAAVARHPLEQSLWMLIVLHIPEYPPAPGLLLLCCAVLECCKLQPQLLILWTLPDSHVPGPCGL